MGFDVHAPITDAEREQLEHYLTVLEQAAEHLNEAVGYLDQAAVTAMFTTQGMTDRAAAAAAVVAELYDAVAAAHHNTDAVHGALDGLVGIAHDG